MAVRVAARAGLEDLRCVRFPPGSGNVLVPRAASRASAAAGVSLYTASRPIPLLLQTAAWTCARLAGPRVLPGSPSAWTPPVPSAAWDDLAAQWERVLGPVDELAIYERKQASRSGIGLLLQRAGRPRAFVKLRRGGEGLHAEQRILHALTARRPRSFEIPEPLGEGGVGEWRWSALSPLPPRPTRPCFDAGAVLRELPELLADCVARPVPSPPASAPMHGDLTPWNLRRAGRGRPWLIDWEDAGYGPTGADEVYFSATAAVLRRQRSAGASREPRAVAHWLAVVAARSPRDADRELNLRLREQLRSMGATS